MRWTWSWALAGFTALAGCASPPEPAKPAGPPPAAGAVPGATTGVQGSETILRPSDVVPGKISLVNPNARYVVVSYPVGALPELGRRLNVFRNGLKVGEIKITGPQRDLNIVADIVAGQCQRGDEVRPD